MIFLRAILNLRISTTSSSQYLEGQNGATLVMCRQLYAPKLPQPRVLDTARSCSPLLHRKEVLAAFTVVPITSVFAFPTDADALSILLLAEQLFPQEPHPTLYYSETTPPSPPQLPSTHIERHGSRRRS